MDPQLDGRLRTIEKKLDESNAIIVKLYRSQRRARAMKYVYWGIVIALTFISISLIKPYLSQLGDAYGVSGGNTDGSDTNLNDLLK